MSYTIKSLPEFREQLSKLDSKSRRIVKGKIALIKENPFRYKRLHSKQYKRVFRVRLEFASAETRMIYVVVEPNVILVCFLERKNDYKELGKYLKKIKA